MLTSVIIPNLNSPVVGRTVEAVLAQTSVDGELEILVVGRDELGSVPRLGVMFIDTGRPVGASVARNIGIGRARGELLAFTDADCVPEPEWLAGHQRAQAAGHPVVGGSVLYPSTDYWTLADNIAMYHEFSPLSPPGRRTFLATNNLSTARQVAALAGGQDESLLRGQDLDWTIRMRLAGVELYFDPTIRVWHEPHRSGARSMLRRWLRSGHYMLRVRRRYPEAFGTPAWLYHRWAVVGLAPLIALWSTARVFRPGSIGARYLRTLPAVYITRLAWCLGAATVVSEP